MEGDKSSFVLGVNVGSMLQQVLGHFKVVVTSFRQKTRNSETFCSIYTTRISHT